MIKTNFYKPFIYSNTIKHSLLHSLSARTNPLQIAKATLRKKCPYSELFWSVFSRIRTEGEILRISSYSVRKREKTEQNNSEYEHVLRSAELQINRELFLFK